MPKLVRNLKSFWREMEAFLKIAFIPCCSSSAKVNLSKHSLTIYSITVLMIEMNFSVKTCFSKENVADDTSEEFYIVDESKSGFP
jgi:hypothetical protein